MDSCLCSEQLLNKFFNDFLNSSTPLNKFVTQYDKALDAQYDKALIIVSQTCSTEYSNSKNL